MIIGTTRNGTGLNVRVRDLMLNKPKMILHKHKKSIFRLEGIGLLQMVFHQQWLTVWLGVQYFSVLIPIHCNRKFATSSFVGRFEMQIISWFAENNTKWHLRIGVKVGRDVTVDLHNLNITLCTYAHSHSHSNNLHEDGWGWQKSILWWTICMS